MLQDEDDDEYSIADDSDDSELDLAVFVEIHQWLAFVITSAPLCCLCSMLPTTLGKWNIIQHCFCLPYFLHMKHSYDINVIWHYLINY